MLIVGDGDRMLADGSQTSLRHRERIFCQRRELVPLLRLVAEDPFNRICVVIEANDKVFPARDEDGVVRTIIGDSVAVEPIPRKRKDKLTGVITAGDHGLADDFREVPALEHSAGTVHFKKDGPELLSGVRFQDQAELSEVDVVVKNAYAKVLIIVKQGNGAIELNSIEIGMPRLIDRTIVKKRRLVREGCRSNPA